MKSVADGTIVAPSGVYNPTTRIITWFIGEVGSREGGIADVKVRSKADAPDGTVILNYATVYFPSVPEITKTNVIVTTLGEPKDILPPTTTHTLTGTLLAPDTYLGATTIGLMAEDNEGGVGVESTAYSLDGETWLEYTAPVEVTEEGTHTIYYRSTDWFGNKEDTKSVTFTIIIDITPPVTTLEAKSTGETPWFNSGIVVTLSATDDNTGVALTEYSLDIGDTWVPYSEPFILRGEAEYTLWYRSIDEAGNIEEAKEVILNTSLIINLGLVTAQTATSRGSSETRIRPIPLPQVLGVATTALSDEEEEKDSPTEATHSTTTATD